MNVSELFKTFGPSLIAHCTALASDYKLQPGYFELAKQIIKAPPENISFIIVKDKDGNRRIGGVENSTDIFKLMPLDQLANLEFGYPPSLQDAVYLLESYSFFKL